MKPTLQKLIFFFSLVLFTHFTRCSDYWGYFEKISSPAAKPSHLQEHSDEEKSDDPTGIITAMRSNKLAQISPHGSSKNTGIILTEPQSYAPTNYSNKSMISSSSSSSSESSVRPPLQAAYKTICTKNPHQQESCLKACFYCFIGAMGTASLFITGTIPLPCHNAHNPTATPSYTPTPAPTTNMSIAFNSTTPPQHLRWRQSQNRSTE